MAEVINLRQKRKEAARAASKAKGDANAAKFGRSKVEKEREALEAARAKALLDGALLDGARRETDPETDKS